MAVPMVRSHSDPLQTKCAQQTHLSAVKNSLRFTAMMFGALPIFTGMEPTGSRLVMAPASTKQAIVLFTQIMVHVRLLILNEHESATTLIPRQEYLTRL